jgi:hypothetical protein
MVPPASSASGCVPMAGNGCVSRWCRVGLRLMAAIVYSVLFKKLRILVNRQFFKKRCIVEH